MFLVFILFLGTILSDSMCRFVETPRKFILQAYGGATITSLTDKVRAGTALVRKFPVIVILVGTNDIQGGNKEVILKNFDRLIKTIRQIHSSVNLFISAILPRPVDFVITRDLVAEINTNLSTLCAQRKVTFLNTHRIFFKLGLPDSTCFRKRDGLHLNTLGVAKLSNFFSKVIAHAE